MTTAADAARGIFGQGIFIDPQRQLVIASNANWAGGDATPKPPKRAKFFIGKCKKRWTKSGRRPRNDRRPRVWEAKAWSRIAAVCVIRAEELSGLHAQRSDHAALRMHKNTRPVKPAGPTVAH